MEKDWLLITGGWLGVCETTTVMPALSNKLPVPLSVTFTLREKVGFVKKLRALEFATINSPVAG